MYSKWYIMWKLVEKYFLRDRRRNGHCKGLLLSLAKDCTHPTCSVGYIVSEVVVNIEVITLVDD